MFRRARLQFIEQKEFDALSETLDGDFLQSYLELAPRDQELVAEQALHETKADQDAFQSAQVITPRELRLILAHLKH
jgi:hypothetical protein